MGNYAYFFILTNILKEILFIVAKNTIKKAYLKILNVVWRCDKERKELKILVDFLELFYTIFIKFLEQQVYISHVLVN